MSLLIAAIITTVLSVAIFGTIVVWGRRAADKPPLMAINMLDRRYEKCPGCRKWHYITTKEH